MADLIPVPAETPVPQLETTTLALGGTGNPMNQQAQALLNRIALLSQTIASIQLELDQVSAYAQDLQSSSPGEGSALIAYGSQTVEDALDERPIIGGLFGDSFEYGPEQPEAQFAIPTGPMIRRQRCTTQNLEIFVDAAAAPGGDGSQLSPYKTINRALEDVPREIYHKVRIYLADGVYAGSGNDWNLFNYFVSPVSVAGFQIYGHVPENPLYTDTNISAVVLGDASGANTTSNFVIGGVHGDADDTKIAGVTFDGRVQLYGGLFAFDRCNFKTGRNARLIDGHSGRAKFVNCDFSNCATAISCADVAHFYLNVCTGSNLTTAVAEVRNGSILTTENSPSFNSAGPLWFVEGNSIGKVDGKYLALGAGTEGWGVSRSDTQANLIRVNTSGDVIAGRALVGGAGGVLSLPGNDTFGFYDVAGDIFLRVDVAGTLKTLKVYDFATNTWL